MVQRLQFIITLHYVRKISDMKASSRNNTPSSSIFTITSSKGIFCLSHRHHKPIVTLRFNIMCIASKPSHWHKNSKMLNSKHTSQYNHLLISYNVEQMILQYIVLTRLQALIEKNHIIPSVTIHCRRTFNR